MADARSSSSAPASAASPSPSAWPPPAAASSCSSATTSPAASWRRSRHDGFTFDVGPSLLTLPHVFDELFRVGRDVARRRGRRCVRLDPQFHYRWPDGSALVVPDDADARGRRVRGVRARAPARRGGGSTSAAGGSGTSASGRSSPGRWPGRSALARAGCARPRDLLAIDPLRTLHRRAAAHFDDPRLVQWAGRYATYSGSSPYRAPATLACIPHVESRYGCWYPRGGLDARARRAGAGRRAARRRGAHRRARSCGSPTAGDAVAGVELADGRPWRRRVVVANVDAEHVYGDLLPDERRAAAGAAGRPLDERPRRARRRVRGATPGSATTTCGSPATTAPSSPPSTPAGWPTTRRSTPASRRSPTRRRRRRAPRTGSCSSTRRPGSRLDARRRARAACSTCSPRRGVDLRERVAWTRRDHAARPGGAVPGRRRGDLRHVVERPAGRVPAARQPRRPARAVPRRRLEPSRRRAAARR